MSKEIIYRGEKLKVLRVSTASKSDDPNVNTAYICETEDGGNITILNTEAERLTDDGQSNTQDSGQPGTTDNRSIQAD